MQRGTPPRRRGPSLHPQLTAYARGGLRGPDRTDVLGPPAQAPPLHAITSPGVLHRQGHRGAVDPARRGAGQATRDVARPTGRRRELSTLAIAATEARPPRRTPTRRGSPTAWGRPTRRPTPGSPPTTLLGMPVRRLRSRRHPVRRPPPRPPRRPRRTTPTTPPVPSSRSPRASATSAWSSSAAP